MWNFTYEWERDFIVLMSGIRESDIFLTGCGISYSLEASLVLVSDLWYSFFFSPKRKFLITDYQIT